MNWEKEVEVEGKGGKVVLKLADIQDTLAEGLTKDELEEFAGEMKKWVERCTQNSLGE